MSDTTRLALERIERRQRHFKLALAAALVLEALLIGALVLFVNFADRVQALIFISAIGGYTLMAVGLVILAAHLERTLLRALQAGK